MVNLNINRKSIADVIWNIIFSHGSFIIDQTKSAIISKNYEIEALRKSAEYNTGSISIAASICIVMVTNYFRPRIIAEIGTFIGRSTYSLALGQKLCEISKPEIHTCDLSNDITLDFDPILKDIVQYPKSSSTNMLNTIKHHNVKPDLYLFDGRVQIDDLSLLLNLQANNAIIVLDDFEGTEKGVINAIHLTNTFKDNYLLVYPPTSKLLESFNILDSSTTAVLIPKNLIKFVNQG